MDNTIFGFEELEVWKKARLFKSEIRVFTKTFPSEEKFKLTDLLTHLFQKDMEDLLIRIRFIFVYRLEVRLPRL